MFPFPELLARSADLSTVTSCSSQSVAFGWIVTIFAERLNTLTGTLAEVPGLSSVTTRGQTCKRDVLPSCADSVTADVTSLVFLTNPVIVFASIGCKLTLLVAFIEPNWLLQSDMKASFQLCGT